MNIRQTLLLIFLLGTQFYGTDGFAQLASDKKLTQYILRNYSTDDGLQSNTVLNIVKTNDGFLWTGSYDGLARFDGKEFRIYNTRTLAGLKSNSISGITVINGNELIVGTRGKGAYRIKNNKATLIHPNLADKFVTTVYQASNHDIWIGTNSEGLYVINAKGDNFIPIEGFISSIIEVGPDEFWISTHTQGIYILKSGKVVATLNKDNGLRDNYVNSLTKYGNSVYVCSQGGVNSIDITTLSIQVFSELNGVVANNIKFDSLGNLWIASYRGIFRKMENKPIEVLDERNGLENQEITDLLFDREGNAWFTSYRAGLFQLLDGKFANYSFSEGLSSSSVRTVFELNKQQLLFGCENGGIDQLRNGVITQYPLKNKLTKGVYDFKLDKEGNLWIASHDGLIKKDRLGNEKVFTTANGLTSNLIRCIFFDKLNQLWIGTRNNGLMVMKDEKVIKTYSTSDLMLGSDLILSIRDNSKGDVIVCTNSAGFYIFRNGFEIQQYSTANGLKTNIVFNVYPDREDPERYWIVTSTGLSMLNGDKLLSFEYNEAFTEISFFDVLEDDLGYFWIPSPKGVLRVSKRELVENSKDSTKNVSWKLYGHQDGIKSPQCLGAARSLLTSSGEIWIPATKGVTSINPDRIKVGTWKPPVYISSVELDEHRLDSAFNQLQIEPGLKRMSIRYGSISYYFNEGVKYKVKLEPYDEKWFDVQNKREVVYTNLPVGRYRFKVQACNSDGVWNEAGASFDFTIMPFFYETYLFYITVGFVGVIGILLFVKLRTYQISSRNKSLQQMIEVKTSELRRNLDDLKRAQVQLVQSEKMASLGLLTAGIAHEINNPVNFISVGISALEKKLNQLNGSINGLDINEGSFNDIKQTQEKIDQLIQDIKIGTSRTEEIVSSLRTFSHLDKAELKVYDINEGIESTLVLLNSRFKDRIEIVKQLDRSLPQILCYPGQLNQVIMNILSNAIDAIRGAGTITITTAKGSDQVEISIADTGSGIPKDAREKIFEPFFTTKDVGLGTGLGLSISYSIIQEHKGTIEVLSEEGKGSKFIIKVPSTLKYRDKGSS